MLIRSETWQVAFEALRANKVKAALTMLGVVIGSAGIVLVVTVALTGKKYIIAQIEGVGSNIVYAQVVRAGAGQAAPLADEITLADLDAVRKAAPLAAAVAGTRETPMTVVVEGIERPVNLVGVTEQFQSIRMLQIVGQLDDLPAGEVLEDRGLELPRLRSSLTISSLKSTPAPPDSCFSSSIFDSSVTSGRSKSRV